MVRAVDPAAGALLDAMAADHATVDPAVQCAPRRRRRWAADAGAPGPASTRSPRWRTCFCAPRARGERGHAGGVGDDHATASGTWDQKHNIKPKSLPKLAEEGLWLMDGLDPARRAIVEAEVPWVPRMIVLHGFGPGYRRRSAAGGQDAGHGDVVSDERQIETAATPAGWKGRDIGAERSHRDRRHRAATGGGVPDRTTAPDSAVVPTAVDGTGGAAARRDAAAPQTGAAEVVVDAPPEAVWAVLADVTPHRRVEPRVPRRRVARRRAAAAPGVRFRGRNRAGALVRSARVCVIREVRPAARARLGDGRAAAHAATRRSGGCGSTRSTAARASDRSSASCRWRRGPTASSPRLIPPTATAPPRSRPTSADCGEVSAGGRRTS